jgi:organic hydroperoxide reductase OsmC/OhrA
VQTSFILTEWRREPKKEKTTSKLTLVNQTLPSLLRQHRVTNNKMKDNLAEIGALAHHGHDFCPYAAVAKFPYKYISRNLMQPVSDNFFANGLLRERGWTL